MQASLTFPPEGDLISGDNPVYIGDVNRGESRTVNWTLVFTASGIFDLDVKASGYREDTGEYVETHGFAGATVSLGYADIDVVTAYNMITGGLYPNLVVLDVRNQSEYDSGHIYRAVWIPVWQLEARIGELAGHEDHEIIVYCKSGGRSVTASEILYSHNFTPVYNMLGGILSWQSAGYPVWIASVHNVNTTFNYDTIQAAIDTPQTLDGHKITVDTGTYHEHVVVKKTLSLIGENKQTTIIDGDGMETVVRITADNVTVTGFTIQNGYSGLISEYCNDSVVSGNLILNNQVYGIEFYQSNNNYLEDNVASNNGYGICLRRSTNNTLGNNNLTNNNQNFAIEGEPLSEFIHEIDTSNIVDGNPIHYLVNQRNKQIPAQAGYVAAINSINITVRNANLTNNSHGVLFLNTTDSNIENVNASDNSYGITLVWSNHTKIVGNTILHASEEGIVLEAAANNRIIGNTIGFGAGTGIYLYQSRNNLIYHNNFIQNWDQVYSEDSINTWDDDHPSGGNYWSDYTDVDLFSGTYQNMTGGDGIGDKPYDIDEYNQDRYPLMKPYGGPHDIGIVNVTTSKTVVVQGQNLSINVKTVNYGVYNETFNVTAYASQTIIQRKAITLASRNSTTVAFTWNTTGVEKGDYTISAEAGVVLGETETTDNTKVDGTVTVIVPGHDVAIKNVSPSKTVVAQNYSLTIQITAKNCGNHTETFNVAAYYNSNIINYTTITNLPPGEQKTITLTWNTNATYPTPVPKGNYTITAIAETVPEETDTTDNTLADSWVIVAMVGDITGGTANPWEFVPDGKVDGKDRAVVCRCFGSWPKASPPMIWHPNCDINNDGQIDGRDITIAAKNFGKTDP